MEKFIVLDVEGMQNKRPYNVGYIVADRNGKIYKRRSFAFLFTIWENICEALRVNQAVDMAKKNIQEILQDANKPFWQKKYKCISEQTFAKTFSRDIQRYKVKRIFAYNVQFDKRAIFNLIGAESFESLNVQWCDIISGILTTKLLTKNYIKWCFTNGFTTPTGIASYKAEIVYRYLTGKLNFEEEHTGLADVLIEYEILLAAFKTHKKLDFTPVCAWRQLKNFATENNLSAA